MRRKQHSCFNRSVSTGSRCVDAGCAPDRYASSMSPITLANMKPFLLVSTRPEEEALDSEYHAYLRASGLDKENLKLAELDLVGLPTIDPSDYSGVFVAGSPYGASAPDGYVSETQQWVFEELRGLFSKVLEAKVPVFATGTSMTILAEVLNAEVTADLAEYAELVDIESVREAEGDPIYESLPHAFPAYVNHGAGVSKLPEGATRLARSLNTPVQVFRYGDRTYGVQFNPELDGKVIERKMEAYEDAGDTGFGDAESLVQAGRHSTGEHCGGRMIRNFVNVFAEED